MVLYEFLMIIKAATPRAQVADILRRAGNRVFDHNGVLTDITSYGTRQLAYKFKTPGETHFEVSGDGDASRVRLLRPVVVREDAPPAGRSASPLFDPIARPPCRPFRRNPGCGVAGHPRREDG